MLVLGRRVDEKLIISNGTNEIVVTVVRVQGLGVRLGIEAPREYRVLRSELQPRDGKPGGGSSQGDGPAAA